MEKNIAMLVVVVAMLSGMAGNSVAGDTATMTLNLSVAAIKVIDVSPDWAIIEEGYTKDGKNFVVLEGKYSVTCNTSSSIQAKLESYLNQEVYLEMKSSAGVSLGQVNITDIPVDLVTGISGIERKQKIFCWIEGMGDINTNIEFEFIFN